MLNIMVMKEPKGIRKLCLQFATASISFLMCFIALDLALH